MSGATENDRGADRRRRRRPVKNGSAGKISVVSLLAVLAIATLLIHFSGCVAIPEHVVVISGSRDQVLERVPSTCDAGAVDTARDGGGLNGVDPKGFSILSWNAHKGTHADWDADLTAFAAAVDFILLQEAALNPGLKSQLKALSRQWLLAPAFQSGDMEFGILSAGIVSSHFSCAERQAEPLIVVPKMTLAGTYPVAGSDRELLLVNVHLVNFTLGVEVVRRQMETIAALIAAHRGPVIVAGDFNTWNEERENVVRQEMSALGMQPVRFDPDNRVTFFSRTVDAVYYRDLEVVRALTHPVTTSDHNPLEVHFRVAPSGSI